MKIAKYIVCDDKDVVMTYKKFRHGGQFTYEEKVVNLYTKIEAKRLIALTNKWRNAMDYPINIKYKLILVK